VDNLGGFLVPDDWFNELIKDLPGFTVMRPLCRVRRTMRQTGTFMTVRSGTNPYSSGLSGNWKAEGYVVGGTAPPTQDQPTFGLERVPTHIWSPDVIEITIDLLEDAAIDLDAEVRGLLAEVKGLDEDWAFLKGPGGGLPQGIMTVPGVATVPSGVSGGQTYAGIVNLYTSLPAQYRPRATWIMNSLTYGLLLLVSDDQNRPLFPVNQLVNQLFNRPIAFSEFMDDGDTGGNHPILFGDFSYYGIVDRRDMRIQRLTERYAPNIGLLAYARTGGQPLKTGPFRKQVVGVS
jgi:HK97 family phage major capsid protein